MTKLHTLRGGALAIIAALAPACVATATTATTWREPAVVYDGVPRYGHVETVTEYVRRDQGDPAGGALAGALIGGFLFGGGRGPGALFGAVTGAAVGAAASQGSSETRSYQVVVRFGDGSYGAFVYAGGSPFQPGEPVVLTEHGLAHASPPPPPPPGPPPQ
jgi:outer membrane lipoprotein SlyB